jgi:hypothetical protein
MDILDKFHAELETERDALLAKLSAAADKLTTDFADYARAFEEALAMAQSRSQAAEQEFRLALSQKHETFLNGAAKPPREPSPDPDAEAKARVETTKTVGETYDPLPAASIEALERAILTFEAEHATD